MMDMEKTNKLGFETVSLDDDASALVIIDQTRLPNEQKILRLTTQKEIWDAIYLLQVRGAPAIGVAAAYLPCGKGNRYDGLQRLCEGI